LTRSQARRPPRTRAARVQRGQGLVEYGLIVGIMLLVCVMALVFFGDQLAAILGFIASKV